MKPLARENKVHRNFKIQPRLDYLLRRESAAAKRKGLNLNQTDIVQKALTEYFAIKH